MITSTSQNYRGLVAQLDASGYPDVPPELARAREALRAVDAAWRQLDVYAPLREVGLSREGMVRGRQSATGPAAYAESLARRLGDGEPLPPDLVAQSYAAAVHDAQAAATDAVVRDLAAHVVANFDMIAEESVPALLAGLGRQLEEIVSAVKAAGTALADHDVEDAASLVGARADCRAAYQELGRLAEEYDRLRVAQRATERNDEVADYDLYVRLGLVDVEDAFTLWPGWREAERDRRTRLPWPGDKRARLLLIASRRAWVATLARMTSLRSAALSGQVAA